MNVSIIPGSVKGALSIPPSKSHTQRIFAAALLSGGTTIVTGYGTSEDEQAALNIVEQLGAIIEKTDNALKITSSGITPVSGKIDCGESGLAARLFTPIAALSDQPITITGNGSLLKRPMNFFKEYLPSLSVSVTQDGIFLPVTLTGPLQPKNITVDGSLSSQFLSGLLMAFAFTSTDEVTITVRDLVSRPYIDLTLTTIKQFNRVVKNDSYQRFTIQPSSTNSLTPVIIHSEADWSSASYWIVAGLISGSITLKGLNNDSVQADRAILNIIKHCGGNFSWEEDCLSISRTTTLVAFDFDATDCPDLFPILTILATQCNGSSSIKGLHRLLHKESNRKDSITAMLTKFGVTYQVSDNRLIIHGTSTLNAATIHSFDDHRIAMAASIAALRAGGNVMIKGAECVAKSYPDFFRHLQQLGINTTIAL